MYILEIGGAIVQYGKNIEDITLLNNDNLKLICYHQIKLNGDLVNEDAINSDKNEFNEETIKVDYFDGEKNNVLHISCGMAMSKYCVQLSQQVKSQKSI